FAQDGYQQGRVERGEEGAEWRAPGAETRRLLDLVAGEDGAARLEDRQPGIVGGNGPPAGGRHHAAAAHDPRLITLALPDPRDEERVAEGRHDVLDDGLAVEERGHPLPRLRDRLLVVVPPAVEESVDRALHPVADRDDGREREQDEGDRE